MDKKASANEVVLTQSAPCRQMISGEGGSRCIVCQRGLGNKEMRLQFSEGENSASERAAFGEKIRVLQKR